LEKVFESPKKIDGIMLNKVLKTENLRMWSGSNCHSIISNENVRYFQYWIFKLCCQKDDSSVIGHTSQKRIWKRIYTTPDFTEAKFWCSPILSRSWRFSRRWCFGSWFSDVWLRVVLLMDVTVSEEYTASIFREEFSLSPLPGSEWQPSLLSAFIA
jgi:hypothetical protein